MSICKNEESKLKYKELKYFRCQYSETRQGTQDPGHKNCIFQYAEIRKVKSNIQNKILQMLICRDE